MYIRKAEGKAGIAESVCFKALGAFSRVIIQVPDRNPPREAPTNMFFLAKEHSTHVGGRAWLGWAGLASAEPGLAGLG